MKNLQLKLSILDQVSIRKNSTATEALKETTELAAYADKLGYTRFWVSEHHNFSTLASPTPEILIAHLANHTQNIRIGSGGVMLPNHSTLKIAENFKLLESLFPGRIDLGIGRAPGTDRFTASLLNPSNTFQEQNFIEQLYHLDAFFHNIKKEGTLFEKVQAIPVTSNIPDLWLLSSSGESAVLAANYGMRLSFAQFINGNGGEQAVQYYKKQFHPSEDLKTPQTNVAIFAFCSENEEAIQRNEAIMDFRFIQLERRNGNLNAVTYEDIKNEPYSSYEKERIAANRKRMICGTPEKMKENIEKFASDYGTDEIMLITYAENKEERFNSYKLLADIFLTKKEN